MNQTKADSVNFDLRICTVFYLWFGNLFDHHDELKTSPGRIQDSGKGVHMYKGVGFHFADFISFS